MLNIIRNCVNGVYISLWVENQLTSSLLISLIKWRTSFMAAGVGANTENVSSSTWFIVTPQKDKTEPPVSARANSISTQFVGFFISTKCYLFVLAACEGCNHLVRRSVLVWKQAHAHFLNRKKQGFRKTQSPCIKGCNSVNLDRCLCPWKWQSQPGAVTWPQPASDRTFICSCFPTFLNLNN